MHRASRIEKTMPDTNPQTMACMEVWGGNVSANNSVAMSGLDAWVYSKPFAMAQGGGDVYYVSSCATGRITRLLVADVSGHGEQVRQTANVLRDLMRRFVNHLDQRQFVRSMNQQFTQLSDAGCFATAVVTTFFGPTNYLTICNAGHPTPLIYRAGKRQWTLLERGESSSDAVADIPLGIDDMCDYEQMSMQLDVGDLVICYSDSLMESKDADGQMLGEQGLLAITNEIDVSDPAKVVTNLIEAIARRAPGNLEADDVTILLFHPNGSGTRVSFRHKLAAPFRVCAGMLRSILPGGGPAPLPDLSIANIGGAMFDGLNRRCGRRNA